jgi:hypothetical protein
VKTFLAMIAIFLLAMLTGITAENLQNRSKSCEGEATCGLIRWAVAYRPPQVCLDSSAQQRVFLLARIVNGDVSATRQDVSADKAGDCSLNEVVYAACRKVQGGNGGAELCERLTPKPTAPSTDTQAVSARTFK